MFDAKARPRLAWQWQPLVPIGIAAFSLSSLISYHVRQPEVHSALQAVVSGIYRAIGFVPACMFFILVLAWSSIWFVRGELVRPGARVLRLCGFTLATAILVNLRSSDGLPPPAHTGVIGSWLATRLMDVFGYVLSILLVAPAFFVTCVLATDWFFARFFDDLLTTGPRSGDGQRMGGEDGVEAAATEHLKGLALAGLQPTSAPLSATAVMAPAADEAEAAEPDAMASALAEFAEESEAGAGPRLTAFERRQMAARQLAAAIDRASEEAEAEAEAEALAEAAALAAEAETVVQIEPYAAGMAVASDAADVDTGLEDPLADDLAAEAAEDETEADADDDLGAVVSVPTVPPRSVPLPGLDDPAMAAEDESLPTGDADEVAEAGVAAEPETGDPATAEAPLAGVEAVPAADATPAPAADLPAAADAEATAEADAADGEDAAEEVGEAEAAAEEPAHAGESVVQIPRPAEGVRQRRLFADALVDDNLVREAKELVVSSRRASATMLQRKLRIDYEQAMAVLGVLAQRGVIEIQEGEAQGRVLQ